MGLGGFPPALALLSPFVQHTRSHDVHQRPARRQACPVGTAHLSPLFLLSHLLTLANSAMSDPVDTPQLSTQAPPGSAVISVSSALPLMGVAALLGTYRYLRGPSARSLELPLFHAPQSAALEQPSASRSSSSSDFSAGHTYEQRGTRTLEPLWSRLARWLRSWLGPSARARLELPNNDWVNEERGEPNADGWTHSEFHWEPAPRWPRGSEDSEFERRWAPREDLIRFSEDIPDTPSLSSTQGDTSDSSPSLAPLHEPVDWSLNGFGL